MGYLFLLGAVFCSLFSFPVLAREVHSADEDIINTLNVLHGAGRRTTTRPTADARSRDLFQVMAQLRSEKEDEERARARAAVKATDLFELTEKSETLVRKNIADLLKEGKDAGKTYSHFLGALEKFSTELENGKSDIGRIWKRIKTKADELAKEGKDDERKKFLEQEKKNLNLILSQLEFGHVTVGFTKLHVKVLNGLSDEDKALVKSGTRAGNVKILETLTEPTQKLVKLYADGKALDKENPHSLIHPDRADIISAMTDDMYPGMNAMRKFMTETKPDDEKAVDQAKQNLIAIALMLNPPPPKKRRD